MTLGAKIVLDVPEDVVMPRLKVVAFGGTSPYAYALLSGTLPVGVTLDATSGLISGVPTTAGVYPDLVVRASDAGSATFDLAPLTLRVGLVLPQNVTPPSIAGGVTEGSVLTATPGVWNDADTVSGQWLMDGAPVLGATGQTYKLMFADIGKAPSYRETAASGAGEVDAVSNALAPVVNGLLARIMFRGDNTVSADRWVAATQADNGGVERTRAPANSPLGFTGYVFKMGNDAPTNTGSSGSYPGYLRGLDNISGSGGYCAIKVPANTLIKVRVALGLLTSASSGNSGVQIDDGAAPAYIFHSIANQSQAVGNVLQWDGAQILAQDWLHAGAWLSLTSTTGWVYFRKPSGGSLCSLRAIEVAYPSLDIVSAGVGPYHVANDGSGSDVTGDGSAERPWISFPGDPTAPGVLGDFNLLPGAEVRLKATGTPYRALRPLANGDGVLGTLASAVSAGATGFTCAGMGVVSGRWVYLCDAAGNPTEQVQVKGSNASGVTTSLGAPLKLAHPAGSKVKAYVEGLISLRRAGALGQPIRITSYGGGRASLDGSELVAGWSGATSGDVSGNPHAASIEKASIDFAAIELGQTIHEGGRSLYPAQFPEPSDPGAFNLPYTGSDAYVEMTYAEFRAAPVTQGASGSGGVGYRLCSFTSPVLAARYGPQNVSLVGYNIACRMKGNRIAQWPITAHDPATGYVAWKIPALDELIINDMSSVYTANWMWAIRGHPFDIRRQGQYAYGPDQKTIYGWFRGAGERAISRIEYGARLTVDHVEFDGVDFQGFGVDYGGPIVANGRTGVKVANSVWRGCNNASANAAFRLEGAGGAFTLQNIDCYDTSREGMAQIASGASGTVKGVRHRDSGRTSAYFGGVSQSNLLEDFDFSDNFSMHGNGASIYESARNHEVRQGFIMNHVLAYTAQQNPASLVLKANKLKNTVLSCCPAWHGTTNETYGVPGVINEARFVTQVADAETDSLFEGVVAVMANAQMSSSSPSGVPSTGQVVRNCVFSNVVATHLTGRVWQNVLVLNDTGTAPVDSTRLAQLDPASYRVEVGSGSEPWDGTITQKIQKVLTRNGDTETFTSRTLGPLSGPGARPWIVPAWGQGHALGDCALTTTRFRSGARPRLALSSVVATAPGCSISLPAGLGDNAMFGLDRGTVHFVGPAPAPGAYEIVVRQTSSHPDLIGGGTQAHDTAIAILVI